MVRLGRHRGELAQESRSLRRGEWGPSLRQVLTTRRSLWRVLFVVAVCAAATLLVTVVLGADFSWIGPVIAGAIGVTIGAEMKEAAGRARRQRQAD